MKFGQKVSYLDILCVIQLRIAHAEARYGDFASTHEALGVAVEEWDELRAAIHSNDMVRVQQECLDLSAVLIRLAMCLCENKETCFRSQK